MRLLVIWIFSATIVMSHGINLKTEFRWNSIDFLWDSLDQRNYMIDNGYYNPHVIALYDVDRAEDGTCFTTAVREPGVPASLMTVTEEMGEGGPLLRPYPDWSWYSQNYSDCSKIINVYRVAIKCNYIFVLDTGKVGENQTCPPKLLIFDLSDNKLVRNVSIPEKVAFNASGVGLLVTPIVKDQYLKKDKNYRERFLNNVVVYMADTEGFGLVVWKARNSKFCRVESEFMLPTNTHFTIVGGNFSLEDGILGMTSNNGKLYYSPLSGDKIFKMNECSVDRCPNNNQTNKLTETVTQLSGQTGPMASLNSVIFFSNIPDTAIMCLDTKGNNNKTVRIVKDPVRLQFASGMKVVCYKTMKELWIMTNRFQHVIAGTLNLNETNFRILSISMRDINSNTPCHVHPYCYYHPY